MKKNIVSTIILAIFCLFIGFSSIAVAEMNTSKTSSKDQVEITLPEIVCTAEKTSILSEINYREYLNEAVQSIREKMERIELKNIMEEVKSIIVHNSL